MSLSVGIDLGTSACRVAVINNQGKLLSLSRVSLPEPETNGPYCEQNPDDWWQACQQALNKALVKVSRAEISRIAVDGTSSTLLLCEANGLPQGLALMYRDQRAQQQAQRLAKLAPATAAVHSPSSSLAKLLWLNDQGQLKKGLKALHQTDWITGKLTGCYNSSDENNALKLGYDPASQSWPNWLANCGLPDDCLPTVLPAGQLLGPIAPAIAAQFGLSTDCQVVAGTTDSTASFIASGALATGDAVTVLGSTLVIKILGDKPIYAPELGVYSHRLGNKWIIGGASNTGGAVLEQFFNSQQLEQLSKQIDPNQPSELNYMPLPGIGERFPVNDPAKQPVLTPRPASDVDFLHGLLEAMSKIEQQGYATLVSLGAPAPSSIRTCGGGAINPTWQAIRSRLLKVPMLAAHNNEAAFGTALLASGSSSTLQHNQNELE